MFSNSKPGEIALTTLQNQAKELQLICTECTKFPTLCQEAVTLRQNLQAEEQQLNKEILDLETRRASLFEMQRELHNKFKTLADAPAKNEKTAVELINYCIILGFKASNFDYLEDGNKLITLEYNGLGHVMLAWSSYYDMYELMDMQPQHPNFTEIKQFLGMSQDVQGLLRVTRKYFDYLTQANQKET